MGKSRRYLLQVTCLLVYLSTNYFLPQQKIRVNPLYPWSANKIFREFYYYHRLLQKALISDAKSSFSRSKTLLLALPKAVSCFCIYKHL